MCRSLAYIKLTVHVF